EARGANFQGNIALIERSHRQFCHHRAIIIEASKIPNSSHPGRHDLGNVSGASRNGWQNGCIAAIAKLREHRFADTEADFARLGEGLDSRLVQATPSRGKILKVGPPIMNNCRKGSAQSSGQFSCLSVSSAMGYGADDVRSELSRLLEGRA